MTATSEPNDAQVNPDAGSAGTGGTVIAAISRDPTPSDPTPPVGPPDTEGAMASGDFVSDYADYADVLEAPREVHEVVAVSLLAAALNRHVTIRYGALELTLDLWTLILSGSGLGRNTLVSLAYPVVTNASGLSGLVRGEQFGSGPAFYENLALNPNGLFIWPELSQVLRTFSQPMFISAKEWLTDRFDNTRVPDDIRYRTGQRINTPPIQFVTPPRINILATSSVDWFIPSLEAGDITAGFVPRWLIVRVPDTTRIISKPRNPDFTAVKSLAERLSQANKLKGVADLSRVERLYDEWYRGAKKRFEAQPNNGLAMPFFNRLRALVLKLAVIFEVSSCCSLSVSPEAMQRAIDFAVSTESTIFKLLPTGMTPEGFALDKMEQAIRQAGAPGITQSELTRAFQGERYRNREERMATLMQAGKVRHYVRSTGGRIAHVYVHSDFRAQHEKDSPTDKPA